MNLLTFIKTNEDSRLLFSKGEIKIIEKQMNRINLTQSEKNRLSRSIRKKLKFIKEVSRFSGEFEMKKGYLIKEAIDDVLSEIKNSEFFPRIKKIVLFGSAAENYMTFRSDIDISAEFSDISLKDATLFRIYISGRTNQKIDIQVYNHLPLKIRKEIDLKGKVLYKK